ncbi:MAG TPA: ROK family protein [Chloroflexi bacterium]|nr:ROK family protein [Chloroflexota bacterium]
MTLFIGCDLGGTNIKAGVVDISQEKVLTSKSWPTYAREGHAAVMERMAGLIRQVVDESGLQMHQIQGVGISAPGVLDLEKGETIFLPNLHGQWRNVPLADTLRGYLDLPVSMLNDVRAITLGEFTFGAGREVDSIACYAIGTGIGGGAVVNGQLVLGIGGTAGELGHQTIDINGPRCGCGNYGCLEAFASAPAIAAMGVKAVQQGLTTIIGELAGYDLNKITPELIAEAAHREDEIAKEIWENAGHYLGTGIANTLVTIAPRLVVLSGGVAAAGELLLDPIRRTIQERVFVVPIGEINIVTGTLGSEAGIMGMAQWAALHIQKPD